MAQWAVTQTVPSRIPELSRCLTEQYTSESPNLLCRQCVRCPGRHTSPSSSWPLTPRDNEYYADDVVSRRGCTRTVDRPCRTAEYTRWHGNIVANVWNSSSYDVVSAPSVSASKRTSAIWFVRLLYFISRLLHFCVSVYALYEFYSFVCFWNGCLYLWDFRILCQRSNYRHF